MSGRILNVKLRVENRQPSPLYLLHIGGDVPELDLRVYDCNGSEIELFTGGVNSILEYSWLEEIPADSSHSMSLKCLLACDDSANKGLRISVRDPFCRGKRVWGIVGRGNCQQSDFGQRKGIVALRKPWNEEAIRLKKTLIESEGMGRSGGIRGETSKRYLTEVQMMKETRMTDKTNE